MSKLRVYELAKELGVDTKRVMDALRQLGQDPKNHMSTVEGDDAARVTQMVRSPSGRDDAAKASAQTPREAPERRAPDSEVVEVAKPPSAGARPAAPRGKAELPPGMLAPAGFERQFNKVDLRLRDKVRGRPSLPPGAALSGFGGVPGRTALPGNLRGGDPRVLVGGVPRVEREERARPARPADARPGGRFLFAPEEPAEEETLPSEAAVEPGERTGAAEGPTRQEPVAAAPPSEVKAAEVRATAARPSAAEARPAAAHPSVATPPAARVAEPKPAELGAGEAARGGAEVRREPAVRADYLPPATPGEEVPRPAPSRPAVGPGLGPDPSLRPSAQLRRLQAQTGPGAALQPAPRREFAGPSPARPVRSVEGDIGLPVRRPPGARAPLAGPRPGGAPTLGPRPAGAPRPAGPSRPGAPVRPAPAGRGRGRGGRLFVPPPPPEVVPEKQDRRTGGGVQRGDRRRAAVEAGERLREEVRSGQRGDLRRPLRRSSQPVTVRSNRPVVLDGPVQVKELASRMQMTAAEVLRKLIELGVFVTINQELDPETAAIVCQEFGFQVEVKPVETEDVWNEIEDPEEPEEVKKPRPPVVVVMGHVDHGKTSLLDAIRETRVAAGEAGGITQHIGAYTVQVGERMVTFLDTPGHEAFTAMRARGAKVTDVAVLVVAADDGVMPQTVEAIRHAREADVPMVVAINKIDKPGADPEHVKQALTEHGLVSEEWGGETIMVPVSAKQRTNLTQLLEMILLVADVRELRANPDKPARGTVIEAQLDRGRGAVATVLVQAGTLHPGDAFVCGRTYGRVRAMIDDSGKRIKKAGPSVPVVVLGFGDLPEAGDVFRVVEDEKQARSIAERRSASARREMQATAGRVTLDELSERIREGEMKDLVLIVKADVQGSVEALVSSLEKIHNEEARVRVIHSAAGAISESDVMLAAASGAIIIGFNVRPDPNAQRAAERESVDIRLYRVIYDAVDDVEKAIKGLLKPKFREQQLGRAEVRAIFRISRVGTIAGCYVLEGKITKQAQVRVVRDGTVVYEGRLASLKHLKDDVREVAQGFECGMGFENWNDLKEGDVVEAFVVEQVAPEG